MVLMVMVLAIVVFSGWFIRHVGDGGLVICISGGGGCWLLVSSSNG